MYHGEILARGHWPTYITDHQHERILKRLTRTRAARAVGRAIEETRAQDRIVVLALGNVDSLVATECGEASHVRG
jgi:hypothetical protein